MATHACTKLSLLRSWTTGHKIWIRIKIHSNIQQWFFGQRNTPTSPRERKKNHSNFEALRKNEIDGASREYVTNYEIATEAHVFDSLQKDKKPNDRQPIQTQSKMGGWMKETMRFDEWRGTTKCSLRINDDGTIHQRLSSNSTDFPRHAQSRTHPRTHTHMYT